MQGRKSEHLVFPALHRAHAMAARVRFALWRAFWITLDAAESCICTRKKWKKKVVNMQWFRATSGACPPLWSRRWPANLKNKNQGGPAGARACPGNTIENIQNGPRPGGTASHTRHLDQHCPCGFPRGSTSTQSEYGPRARRAKDQRRATGTAPGPPLPAHAPCA